MKKIMVLVAAASLLVACGGNSEKKTDSANEQKTESTDVQKEEQKEEQKELTVEEQAKAYYEKLAAAKTPEEFAKIMEELGKWEMGLSREDQAKIHKAANEWATANPEKFAKIMEAGM